MNACPRGGTHEWREADRRDRGRWWQVTVRCVKCGRSYEQREYKGGDGQ